MAPGRPRVPSSKLVTHQTAAFLLLIVHSHRLVALIDDRVNNTQEQRERDRERHIQRQSETENRERHFPPFNISAELTILYSLSHRSNLQASIFVCILCQTNKQTHVYAFDRFTTQLNVTENK